MSDATTAVVINAPIPTMKITGFFINTAGFNFINESFIALKVIELIVSALVFSLIIIYRKEIIEFFRS